MMYLIDFYITLTLHESVHFIFALFFARTPQLKFFLFFFPYIEYRENNAYLQNCIISFAPILIHLILSISSRASLSFINRIFMLSFLPVTSDGQSFWQNLLKYFNEKRNYEN